MPSLKDYRDRIASVKSTRKITSAMKMVAASKLKKAQEAAEASRPYARSMAAMLSRLAQGVVQSGSGPKLLTGNGRDEKHLLIVVSSDRGLCGGFNGNLVRFTRQKIAKMEQDGKTVQLLVVGRKAYDLLRREMKDKIVKYYTDIGAAGFETAADISSFLLQSFEDDAFDVCSIVYNNFRSVLAQVPTAQQLVPFSMPANDNTDAEEALSSTPYDFEPDEEKILEELLPRNISVQIFRALLDSAAGEQAARMTAMDNATRNAGDMIKNLTLQYNRARQAYITKELIEIISGAEAV
jgi:F-type H+-transporting ATPase subunit gamma